VSDPAVLSGTALAELRAAVEWIGRENIPAARKLRDVVEAAARLIGDRPLVGRLRPELASPPFRSWSLPAFLMLLVYDAATDPVEIVRVVHTSRDLRAPLRDLGTTV